MTGQQVILPFNAMPVVALGGWLKVSVCTIKGRTASVSGVIGDLVDVAACEALEEAVERFCADRADRPALIAHDLHPDFFSTCLASQIAEREGVRTLGVQHHHAHVAAVCAERGVTEPVLGLALDGVGFGSDGGAWGGELLWVDGAAFRRLGHLYPLRLPGGDRAARETWRMGAVALAEIGRSAEIVERFADQPAATTVAAMVECNFNCPPTSSLGRLFDAAAGLLGVCPVQSFEGEAAMILESLAKCHGGVPALAGGYEVGDVLDFRPLLAALADGIDTGYGAALFHATVADGLAAWVRRAADRCGIRRVACGGGCLQNGVLTQGLADRLRDDGITMLTAVRVSPGDAGLSLGQAWVGAWALQEG